MKSFLIKETRGEDRVNFWITKANSLQEAKSLFHMAWHSTDVLGELSTENAEKFEELAKTNNMSPDNDNVKNFLTLMEVKAEEGKLLAKQAEILKRLTEVQKTIQVLEKV